jgi:hypothetical protein
VYPYLLIIHHIFETQVGIPIVQRCGPESFSRFKMDEIGTPWNSSAIRRLKTCGLDASFGDMAGYKGIVV